MSEVQQTKRKIEFDVIMWRLEVRVHRVLLILHIARATPSQGY